MKLTIKMTLILTFIALTVSGCQKSSDDTNMISGIAALALASDQLSGIVSKGAVSNSTVIVYALNSDGTQGAELARTQTNSSGEFAFQNRFTGDIEIISEGGSYTDEATGELVQIQTTERLRLQLSEGTPQQNSSITPLTTMACERTRTRIQEGSSVSAAIVESQQMVATKFGLSGIDIAKTGIDDWTDPNSQVSPNRNESAHGLVLAAMTQTLASYSISSSNMLQLVNCYAEDLKDGDIDDNDGTSAVACSAGITSQNAYQYMNQAMNEFMLNNRNQHQGTNMNMPGIPAP